MLLFVAIAVLFHYCVNAQDTSGCGSEEDITNKNTITVQSPGYPTIWNQTLACEWKIFSSWDGTAIQFEIVQETLPKGVSLKIYSGPMADGVVLYPNKMEEETVQSCVNLLIITFEVHLPSVGKQGDPGGFYGTAVKSAIKFGVGCCYDKVVFTIQYSGKNTDCYSALYGGDHQINIFNVTYADDEDYILGYTFDGQSSYAVVFNFSKAHTMDDTHLLFPPGSADDQFIYFHSPSKKMTFNGLAVTGTGGEISITVSSNGDYSYVYSPNHPLSYISGMTCAYDIQTSDIMLVRITVEEKELTVGDTITICRDQEGSYCSADKIDDTISYSTPVNSSYVSKANSFTIFFKSYAPGLTPQRFKLRLEAIYPRSSFACGSITDMTGMDSAVLVTPGYPKILNGSQTCRWTVKGWPGTTIKFSVLDYNTTTGVTVRIYHNDTDSGSMQYLKEGSGIYSVCSGIATVVYKVNIPSFSGPIRGGFYARVTHGKPSLGCCSGTAYSTVTYSKLNEDCSVQITGKTPSYVQLDNVQATFHDNMDYILGYIALYSDTFTVYNQVFRYSKNNTFDGSSLFLPYSSKYDTYIYFHSPSQELSFSGSLAYTGGKCQETIVLGSSSDVKYLFSPNYPDKYIPQMDCRYDVQAPSGNVVKVTLVENHLADSDFITVCSDKTTYCSSSNTVGKITYSTSRNQSYKSGHNQMSIFFTGMAATSSSQMTFKLKLEPVTAGLSTGAIIGIVVACIIAVAFIVIIVVGAVVLRRNRNNRSSHVQPAPVHYATAYPQSVAYGAQPQYGQQPGASGVYPNQPAAYPNTGAQPPQTVPGFQSCAM